MDTPTNEAGVTDLSQVFNAVEQSAHQMAPDTVIAIKSTIPIGAMALIKKQLVSAIEGQPRLAYDPVFIKDGNAINDFMRPDRLIVGVEDESTEQLFKDIYDPFTRTNNPIFFMDFISAEVTKLTVNAILATRISFINEIALLCDEVGADVKSVRRGVGSDSRLGKHYLFAGLGYGGRRFPKDVREMIKAGEEHGLDMHLLRTTDAVNERQKIVIGERIAKHFDHALEGRNLYEPEKS